ncbi:hypothetical protein [Bacillus arachidis]|uniref:hypothetical protein n=1 Tax=Bacillus arachidis TaxID=2819290 RepID=UPI001AA05AA5|nr:hypothetical protein [Bacillus arachidis]
MSVQVEERNKLADRVEVLERVKELLLLPNMEVATSKQVREFYNVDKSTFDMMISRHMDELLADGYRVMKGNELKSLKGDIHYVSHLKEYGISKFTPALALFTKRAILRVGMLLRDSEVAKEVRTQLLNIEEKSTEQVKTSDIEHEERLMLDCFKAMQSGDMTEIVQANKRLNEWQNRFTKEKADKYDL